MTTSVEPDHPTADPHRFGELDAHLLREGTHARLYDKLGAHPHAGGTAFGVWAPHAEAVSVIGDWNGWAPGATPLARIGGGGDPGVWHADVPGVGRGARYQYVVRSRQRGDVAKADPFGLRHEVAPGTASIVWTLEHVWGDEAWMRARARVAPRAAPMAIYEVHLGSWRHVPEEGDRALTYGEVAPRLVAYVQQLGFTHVELMPVTEHPSVRSWGYAGTGYFAATSRHGTPDELMALVDALHQAGIGVILDWVPAWFAADEHGLIDFDGTPLYGAPSRGPAGHRDRDLAVFDLEHPEVRSFLLSSAMFWLDRFHLDGLRLVGVAAMLRPDHGRASAAWVPNAHGGRGDGAAVALLQQLTATVAREQPGAVTIVEEAGAWPQITHPVAAHGLGVDFKWDAAWAHDTLTYLARSPGDRQHHHHELTRRGLYAFDDSFVLPLAHDEVTRGRGSLLARFPGDAWQKRANLRLLLAYMYSQPGKKLLFMGTELAPWQEWRHERSLDWHLVDELAHAQIQLLVGTLNELYRSYRCLHELDTERAGFHWLEVDDADRAVLVYERLARDPADRILIALNFAVAPHQNYRIGVTAPGIYEELLNTDATAFGGSGQGNLGAIEATPARAHGRELSLNLVLPPLGAVFLRRL